MPEKNKEYYLSGDITGREFLFLRKRVGISRRKLAQNAVGTIRDHGSPPLSESTVYRWEARGDELLPGYALILIRATIPVDLFIKYRMDFEKIMEE